MVFDKWVLSTSAIATLLAPVLVGLAPNPLQGSTSQISPTLVSISFPRSPGSGRGPARTASGGTRNTTCFVKRQEDGVTPMTVLMPTNNLGTTVDADPALFLYIPESSIDGGEVIITDSEKQEVYIRQFDLSNKPGSMSGIVKIELEDANLEPGKTYNWIFIPFCNPDNDSDPGLAYINNTVSGQFQRTPLTPTQDAQIEQAETPLDKAEIYARSEIWNETLNLVEQLRPSDPQEWMDLLKSVELEELAEAPYFGESPLMAEDDKSGAEAPSDSLSRDEINSPSTPIEGLW